MSVTNMGYPVVLNLVGKAVLVVGAGRVARRKITGLVGQGATVTVVATAIGESVNEIAAQIGATVWQREFRPSDLDGVSLVFAATSDAAVNEAVANEARARGILASRADQTGGGDFLTPTSFHRGDLLVTLSTSGLSPTLASVLLRRIEDDFGAEFETWAALFGRLRSLIQRIGDDTQRKAIAETLLDNAEVARFVHDGDIDQAQKAAMRLLNTGRD